MDIITSAIKTYVPSACLATEGDLSSFSLSTTCTAVLIPKLLASFIVYNALAAKIPQIYSILKMGSAKGVSMQMYLVENVALLFSIAYNMRLENAFDSYNDVAISFGQSKLYITTI